MEQIRGAASSRGRAVHVASTNKQAADSRAAALASTIRQLMAAGFVSQRELANELNRRGIPTAFSGSWHRTTVWRMLTRLGLITKGRINIGRTNKQAADARAEALASTIRALQAMVADNATILRAAFERARPASRSHSDAFSGHSLRSFVSLVMAVRPYAIALP